jgi:hypothetical protein
MCSPQVHAPQPCDRLSFPGPLCRQRQPAREATAERAADRDQYPRILEESDHLTGAYDPGAWAYCPVNGRNVLSSGATMATVPSWWLKADLHGSDLPVLTLDGWWRLPHGVLRPRSPVGIRRRWVACGWCGCSWVGTCRMIPCWRGWRWGRRRRLRPPLAAAGVRAGADDRAIHRGRRGGGAGGVPAGLAQRGRLRRAAGAGGDLGADDHPQPGHRRVAASGQAGTAGRSRRRAARRSGC